MNRDFLNLIDFIKEFAEEKNSEIENCQNSESEIRKQIVHENGKIHQELSALRSETVKGFQIFKKSIAELQKQIDVLKSQRTETEIPQEQNFALEIQLKNQEILELKAKNKRLEDTVNYLYSLVYSNFPHSPYKIPNVYDRHVYDKQVYDKSSDKKSFTKNTTSNTISNTIPIKTDS
jgi:hypothetical protein